METKQLTEDKSFYLTVSMAAKEMSCSKETIFRLIRQGILKKTYINKRNILLKRSEVESAAERAEEVRKIKMNKGVVRDDN